MGLLGGTEKNFITIFWGGASPLPRPYPWSAPWPPDDYSMAAVRATARYRIFII